MGTLESTIARISPPDASAVRAAMLRQDSLTKPAGSLGELEILSLRIAGITGNPRPRVRDGVVFVMAGDHGVSAEGVSAYPPEVTAQMVANFLGGGAAINVLANMVGARVVVTDVGVIADLPPSPGLHRKKLGRGTGNIARGPAMSREDALRAVEVGIEVFEEEYARKAFSIAATGDMGIGNTTPSTALAALFTGRSPRELAGRGTGIDEARLERKIGLIERALAISPADPADGLGALAALGGFEIGAIAGTILAAASHRVPVLVDGFISGAAALLARALSPLSVEYMIASHASADSGHRLMLEALRLRPLLDLGLRLGEGSGAALAIPICQAACRLLDEMATFDEAGVSEKAGSGSAGVSEKAGSGSRQE